MGQDGPKLGPRCAKIGHDEAKPGQDGGRLGQDQANMDLDNKNSQLTLDESLFTVNCRWPEACSRVPATTLAIHLRCSEITQTKLAKITQMLGNCLASNPGQCMGHVG